MGESIAGRASDSQPHDPEYYQFEKVIGKRRPSGEANLRKLNSKHKVVISLHLRCMSNRDIAFVTGLDELHVGHILRDPLAQEVISSYMEGVESELRGLAPAAVDALRDGLHHDNINTRLKAADRFFHATGRYEQAAASRETAEDVLARALAAIAADQSVQLRELRRPTALRPSGMGTSPSRSDRSTSPSPSSSSSQDSSEAEDAEFSEVSS